jgi:alpha-tubulin suppressor-like RCC1 family protein
MPCQVDVPAADGVSIVFLHIACGSNHCLSVDNKGTLFAWGCGSYGKLGHGDVESRFVPTRVAALEGARVQYCCSACLLPIHLLVLLAPHSCCAGVSITLAAGGTHHSAAVTDGGLVYTWGCASSGGFILNLNWVLRNTSLFRMTRCRPTWPPAHLPTSRRRTENPFCSVCAVSASRKNV